MAEMPTATDDIKVPGEEGTDGAQEARVSYEDPPVEQAERTGEVPGDSQETELPERPPEEGDPAEVLEPRFEPVKRRLGLEQMLTEYTQSPLSFMARLEFFNLLGDVIAKLMDSEKGVTLTQLLSELNVRPGQTTLQDLMQVEVIIRGVARVSEVAPNFMEDCFSIWLNVPKDNRPEFRYLLRLPPSDGGWDDDEGFDVIEVFLEQNAADIVRFFERLPELIQTAGKAREFADHQRSSRRSRRSLRAVPRD
jgi:hypothetical protein